MKKNSEFIGTGTFDSKNDPRILPLGNFLRNTKLNESPVTEYFERRHEHHWSGSPNRRIFLDVSRKFN